MSSNSIYSLGIRRLANRAADLGISFPVHIWQLEPHQEANLIVPGTEIYLTLLGGALMDHIEDSNIRYVFRLIHTASNAPDWYSIQYSDNCELDPDHDIECARGRDKAIQHIYELANQIDQKVTESHCQNGLIKFSIDATLVATVAPMTFSKADEILVSKANSILKQVTSIHNESCLLRILSPLLQSKTLHPACIEVHDTQRQYPIYSTLGNLVTSIQRSMNRLGVRISRGHAQELLSAFFDFPSWNHLRSLERRCESFAINPTVVVDHRPLNPVVNYFHSDCTALAYFSTQIQKGHPFTADACSTYGSLYLRQSHRVKTWLNTDSEDNSLVLYTLPQVDRYDLDDLIPLNQPYSFATGTH